MPSLIDIRRRIRSVRNTQQITKAMKMVSAAKLRRAQGRVMAARPYTALMRKVLANLAVSVGADERSASNPLLAQRPEQHVLLLLFTSDKGLAGAFNTNLIKAAQKFLEDRRSAELELETIGRKGRDFFARRGFPVSFEQTGIFQKLRFEDAQAIAKTATESFLSGAVDRVMLIYNEFRSVMSQRVVVDQLLPIARAEVDAAGGESIAPIPPGGDERSQIDYLYMPSAQEIFNQLLPRYVEVQVYRALLESNAAFFAAQMTAMDTATKNSAEMIGSLTLYMNKVRQAAITREIIEVVSGAQAL